MEYTTLGSTGMEVSRICLGCMSFGSSEWRDWVLDESESREQQRWGGHRDSQSSDTAAVGAREAAARN